MPRETILPGLRKPPRGFEWELTRVQGSVGGTFGEKGFTYYLTARRKGSNLRLEQRGQFVPQRHEGQTEAYIRAMEDSIRVSLRRQ